MTTRLSLESDRLILGALPADAIGVGANRARRLAFGINAYWLTSHLARAASRGAARVSGGRAGRPSPCR